MRFHFHCNSSFFFMFASCKLACVLLNMILIFILVLTVPISNGCMFTKKETPPQNRINPGNWNDMDHDRLIDHGCECGEHVHNETGDPRWNLFISHSKIDDRGNEFIDPVCVASIITSNLIATVLKCVLTSDDVTLNVYHAWLPDEYSKGVVKKSDIIVSTMSGGEGERFLVEEIIFGTNAIQQLAINNHKEDFNIHNDLLLLKVTVNGNEFMGNSRLRPICIPRINSLDFFSRLGTYYGVGIGQHPGNFSSDFHYGIINSQRFCDDGLEKSRENLTDVKDNDNSTVQFESLCMKWIRTEEMTIKNFKGGSLFIQSVKNGAAFLAGVEYQIDFGWWAENRKLYILAYFTNILPMIKYIEYRANQHNSTWCKSTSLILPEKVDDFDRNYTNIPFDGGEIPPEVAQGSWWCVEHQDLMNNKTETDWGRFAEGTDVIKDELYKCTKNKNNERGTIYFYQKGNPEPFGKEALDDSESARRGWICQNFKEEWVGKTDYVSASTCVVLLKECDFKVEFDWFYRDREYPEGNKVPRIVVNKGEKINLEWFGLAKQLTVFRRCRESRFNYKPPVMFYTSGGDNIGYYHPETLCACFNFNSSLGIPSHVINERECLEMYENENCTGWIRTVPAGRNIHTQNLEFKGSVKLPQIKSFARCSVKPNCYELHVSFFKVVLKNKGVKDWNVEYKKYDTYKETISHESAEGSTHFSVKRNLSVLNGTLKTNLLKGVSSIPNTGPYFELEDESSAGVPYTLANKMSEYFRAAYENYIHIPDTEPEQLISSFWIDSPNIEHFGTIRGFASLSYHEWIYKADDVEFSYYALLTIHGRMASGEALIGDLLNEKIAKDLGYDKTEECSDVDVCYMDAVLVRQDRKFSITLSDGKSEEDKNNGRCNKDKVKCDTRIGCGCCGCDTGFGIG